MIPGNEKGSNEMASSKWQRIDSLRSESPGSSSEFEFEFEFEF